MSCVFRVCGLAAQKRAHTAHQLADGLKWFRHDIIGAYSTRLGLVEGFMQADQKHNRNLGEPFTLFDALAQFITADTGHGDAGEDHVGSGLLQFFQGLPAVVDRRDLHSFISEGEAKHRLVVGRVVGD